MKRYKMDAKAKRDEKGGLGRRARKGQTNGKQFMIPTTTPDRKAGTILFRKDIMAKAGLTNPTKISDLEPYFAE